MKVVTIGRGGESSPASADRPTASGRLEFPQGSVDRVARAAGGKDPAQLLAGQPRLDGIARVLDRRAHIGQVVAEIIGARRLPAAAMGTVIERDDEDVGGFEHIARDAERLCQFQRVGDDAQREARHQ